MNPGAFKTGHTMTWLFFDGIKKIKKAAPWDKQRFWGVGEGATTAYFFHHSHFGQRHYVTSKVPNEMISLFCAAHM